MTDRAEKYDALIIGAGAAGLFCASEAAKQGVRVLVIDHANKLCEKIRISGGGRCNFTNIHTQAENFLSDNPKFCVSALKGFTPQHFIERVDAENIKWHEKKLGQLFCDDSAQDIIDLLLDACARHHVTIRTGEIVARISHTGQGFTVETSGSSIDAGALIIATGGKSIPKIGATGFGYDVAKQFGLNVIEPRPALVPLTFDGDVKAMAHDLAGVSIDATVRAAKPPTPNQKKGKTPPAFQEGLLFTHRGLSGPSILQASNYWKEGRSIIVDLCPGVDTQSVLKGHKNTDGSLAIQKILGQLLPKRLAAKLAELDGYHGNIADWPDKKLEALARRLKAWEIMPIGSEGYRTAEVTLGGVDTNGLHSKTMEAKSVSSLYFIGEVVDVTGWLGGYNFQWAWASAHAAARGVIAKKL